MPLWLVCSKSGSWQAQGRPPSRMLGTCHLYQKEFIYILFNVRKLTKLQEFNNLRDLLISNGHPLNSNFQFNESQQDRHQDVNESVQNNSHV